jgi:hypothetical protein
LTGDYIKEGVEGLKISKNHGDRRKPRITDESREIMLSVLFNHPHIFGYLRNKWSLRSLARCLTCALDIQIIFNTCSISPKAESGVNGPNWNYYIKDYEEGKERVENYKHVATALKKRSDISTSR